MRAELFDGKLALLTNTPDLTPAETVTHYKALADIERGFPRSEGPTSKSHPFITGCRIASAHMR